MLSSEQINFIEKYWDSFPYQLDYITIRVLENHHFKRGHDFIIKLDDDLLYGEYNIDNREGYIRPIEEDVGKFLDKDDCYHPASNPMFEHIMNVNTNYMNERTQEQVQIKREQYTTETFKEIDNHGIIHLVAPSGREKFHIPLKNNLQYIFNLANSNQNIYHLGKLMNLRLRISVTNNIVSFRHIDNLTGLKINENLLNEFIEKCKWGEYLEKDLNKKATTDQKLPKL